MEAEVVHFSPPPGGARKERPLTLQEPCVCARARSDNIKATFRARKKKLQIMARRSRPAASQMCMRFRG